MSNLRISDRVTLLYHRINDTKTLARILKRFLKENGYKHKTDATFHGLLNCSCLKDKEYSLMVEEDWRIQFTVAKHQEGNKARSEDDHLSYLTFIVRKKWGNYMIIESNNSRIKNEKPRIFELTLEDIITLNLGKLSDIYNNHKELFDYLFSEYGVPKETENELDVYSHLRSL